ncbi:prion-inhibition and propagation-domain-containing protein [Xylariaceae sp. AK1471]|nr:prion-inhibition and propagation-domain-containing protein [Xylariaceae sp. AK1471]
MTEVAELAIGVAVLWETSVQIHEVLDSARQYGIENGLLNAKFGSRQPGSSPDARFYREDVRTAVFHTLGCIQHVFENTDHLQDHYGLQPIKPVQATSESEIIPSQSQRILNGVFKRAYDNLGWMARERQRGTTLARKTTWALRDRKKLEVFVAEMRGFNDSLESLSPDAQKRVAVMIRRRLPCSPTIQEEYIRYHVRTRTVLASFLPQALVLHDIYHAD